MKSPGEAGFLGKMYEELSQDEDFDDGFGKKITKGFAYYKDLKDIPKPTKAIPEIHSEGATDNLRGKLITPEEEKQLTELTQGFSTGAIYRARTKVGSKEKKNIHPHDFVVEKTDKHTDFYFVDPEFSLASKIRPKTVHLEAIRLHNDKSPSEVIIFRCRAADLPSTEAIKADPLLQEARSLFANKGMPKFLSGSLENEVTIRLMVEQDQSLAQIRNDITVNPSTIAALFKGEIRSPILKGIVENHTLRVRQFIKLLSENARRSQEGEEKIFKPL